MAISTDTVIEFFGTQDLVTSTAVGSLTSSAFATTVAAVNWTNDDDAPEAAFVFIGTWSSAPTVRAPVYLYARQMAIGAGTTDMTQPSSINKEHLLASFFISTSTAVQIKTARAFLPNLEASQVYQFFLENQAGGILSSDYTVHITPLTKGPNPAGGS